jgi:TaqI-like C-terminal specificity domain
MNEYGAGLRGVIEKGRHLWGWIDFGSHQIFDEATVYTALQFFSKQPSAEVAVVHAPNGVVAESPWEADDIRLGYDRLTFGDRWLLITGAERDLIDKLTANGLRLDDPAVSRNIFVGIQTSADHIYHLRRLGPNRYEEKPPKGAKRGRVIEIEDEIMKPLVSGEHANRYLTPETETRLLFPYRIVGRRANLIQSNDMAAEFPNAWAYLKGHEEELRKRESRKMDIDDGWWGYNYPKNLDKQETAKLLVAQTVRSMQVAADSQGAFYINNVRVNGILPARDVSLWTIMAALNAKPCDFYFRKTAKPKDNGYFEANKQFIKYLPIPDAPAEDRAALALDAERLQELNDQRRQALDDIARRMGAVRIRPRPDDWLFPDMPDLGELKDAAPKRLIGTDRQKWAKERLAREREARHAALEEHLKPGVPLAAEFERGELRFLIDGIPAIAGLFPPPEQAPFILAQWKVLASRTEVTARMTGKKIADGLRKVSVSADDHIMADVIRLQEEIATVEAEIATLERRVNQIIYRLHGLTLEEISMIEAAVSMG